LRHDREAADLGRVHVPSNVPDALVPDITVHVAPSVLLEHWMNGSPTDFGVPKPKGSAWRCVISPSRDVRLVPLRQPSVPESVALEAEHAIPSIRDDDCGRRPPRIRSEAIPVPQLD